MPAAVGIPAALATSAAVPPAVAPTATAADPAFSLIAAKRAADIAHCDAIDAYTEAEKRGDAEAEQSADDRCTEACDVVNAADWQVTIPRQSRGL
jgi:hypothetical protein